MNARRRPTALVTLIVLGARIVTACAQREQASPPSPDGSTTPSAASPSSVSGALAPSLAPSLTSTRTEAAPAPPASSSARGERLAPIAEKDWVWRPFRGDHFTVLLPGEPKVTVLPEEDDKVGYTEARVELPGGQVSFSAGFSDFPQAEVAKPEAFLDDHADPPRRGLTDVLHRRSVTLAGGQPGRVVILRRNISGTPLRVYSRLYLVGRRLYSLIVSTLDIGGVSEDVVKKFMDSFKLA